MNVYIDLLAHEAVLIYLYTFKSVCGGELPECFCLSK